MTEPVEAKNPHDALFKKVFGNPAVAAQFFQGVLPPALAKEIDWQGLELKRESFIDEEFHPSASDLLFSTHIGEESALLYCLFEHQSTPDANMPLRLMGYVYRIWQRLVAKKEVEPDHLPPIIPVVLFQGPRSWKGSTRFIDSIDVPQNVFPETKKYLVDFEHILVDLSDWDPRWFQSKILVRGIVAIMKAVRDGRMEEVAPVLSPLMGEVIRQSTATGILHSILYYVGTVGPDPLFTEMRRAIRATQGQKEERRAMTKFAQQILEKGEIKGLRETVFDYLRTHFGEVPGDLRERIDAVQDPERLIQLNRAAWQSDSLEEFEKAMEETAR